MNELYTNLKQFGKVKLNEPMSKHTTFKIGGPADVLLVIDETEQLIAALKYLDGEGIPYFILGGGSNMLVRDEGFQGVVIEIRNRKLEIRDNIITADSGCITVDIAQKSIAAGLTGFEWGVGVPGTIGGAVRGNAGAMGGEMKDVVESVDVYRNGEIVKLGNKECEFGYRESVFKHGGDIILRVSLQLTLGENKDGMQKVLEYLKFRNTTQPQGYASTGCIFKNVEIKKDEGEKIKTRFADDSKVSEFINKGIISAGWLVEKSGMKGKGIGKALVSERHGNFIVNTGGATASDVLSLIAEIKEKVYDSCGIELEEEIQII